jgi:hypothetical protein
LQSIFRKSIEQSEWKEARRQMEAKKLDRMQQHLALMNKYAMSDDMDKVDAATSFIKKDERAIATLEPRQEALQASLDDPTKQTESLYQGEELNKLIREIKTTPELPIRLRTELQKRISRIGLVFMPNNFGTGIIIRYINGVQGLVMILTHYGTVGI